MKYELLQAIGTLAPCAALWIATMGGSLSLQAEHPLADGELTPPIGQPNLASNPVLGAVIYVNGQNTDSTSARQAARLIAEKIQWPVQLVYNDLTFPVVDWFSTLIEKLGDADLSVNAATQTLIGVVRAHIEERRAVYLVGHSAGSLSILNAIRCVSSRYCDKSAEDRRQLLSRIHVLTVGGATFGEENALGCGWPKIGSVHHLYDVRDGIANVWGEGDFWDWFDGDMGDYHGMQTHYVKYLKPSMLTKSGKTRIAP